METQIEILESVFPWFCTKRKNTGIFCSSLGIYLCQRKLYFFQLWIIDKNTLKDEFEGYKNRCEKQVSIKSKNIYSCENLVHYWNSHNPNSFIFAICQLPWTSKMFSVAKSTTNENDMGDEL